MTRRRSSLISFGKTKEDGIDDQPRLIRYFVHLSGKWQVSPHGGIADRLSMRAPHLIDEYVRKHPMEYADDSPYPRGEITAQPTMPEHRPGPTDAAIEGLEQDLDDFGFVSTRIERIKKRRDARELLDVLDSYFGIRGEQVKDHYGLSSRIWAIYHLTCAGRALLKQEKARAARTPQDLMVLLLTLIGPSDRVLEGLAVCEREAEALLERAARAWNKADADVEAGIDHRADDARPAVRVERKRAAAPQPKTRKPDGFALLIGDLGRIFVDIERTEASLPAGLPKALPPERKKVAEVNCSRCGKSERENEMTEPRCGYALRGEREGMTCGAPTGLRCCADCAAAVALCEAHERMDADEQLEAAAGRAGAA